MDAEGITKEELLEQLKSKGLDDKSLREASLIIDRARHDRDVFPLVEDKLEAEALFEVKDDLHIYPLEGEEKEFVQTFMYGYQEAALRLMEPYNEPLLREEITPRAYLCRVNKAIAPLGLKVSFPKVKKSTKGFAK